VRSEQNIKTDLQKNRLTILTAKKLPVILHRTMLINIKAETIEYKSNVFHNIVLSVFIFVLKEKCGKISFKYLGIRT